MGSYVYGELLTSTGNGAVIPPRCAKGVDAPTDIDDERCILFWTRLTVRITGDLSEINEPKKELNCVI